MRYDAYLFIEGIKTRHWLDMLQAIDAAMAEAERQARGRPSEEELKFMDFLAATQRYLLSEGRERPAGMDNASLLLLKPLCQNLVASGRFGRECLDLFSDLDAWTFASRLWVSRASRRGGF